MGLADEGQPGVPQKKGFDEFVGYLSNNEAHDYYSEWLWRYAPLDLRIRRFDDRMHFSENAGGKQGSTIPSFYQSRAELHPEQQARSVQSVSPVLPVPELQSPARQQRGRPAHRQRYAGPSDAPYSTEPCPRRKNKAAMITYLDAQVGHIMDQLVAQKLLTNTVVIFTSDNGPHAEGGVDPKFHQSSGRCAASNETSTKAASASP